MSLYITTHARERMCERNVSTHQVVSVLLDGVEIINSVDGRERVNELDGLVVVFVVWKKEVRVVTTYWRD
jgi:hypothetical protein